MKKREIRIFLFSFVKLLHILPSLVSSCSIDIEEFAYDTDQYRLRCVPELSKDNIARPSTVCIITCKNNPLKFKHRCNLNGNWDVVPNLERCRTAIFCEDPRRSLPQWEWKCSGTYQGSKCYGSCKSDLEIKTEMSCKRIGNDGEWMPKPTSQTLCSISTTAVPSTTRVSSTTTVSSMASSSTTLSSTTLSSTTMSTATSSSSLETTTLATTTIPETTLSSTTSSSSLGTTQSTTTYCKHC